MRFCPLEKPETGENVEATLKPHHHAAIPIPSYYVRHGHGQGSGGKGKEVGRSVSPCAEGPLIIGGKGRSGAGQKNWNLGQTKFRGLSRKC
jgi:hypothetical protein